MKRMNGSDMASFLEIASELNYPQIMDMCEQNPVFKDLCESKELEDFIKYKFQEYIQEKEDKSFPRRQLFFYISKIYPNLSRKERKNLIEDVVHYATDAVDILAEFSQDNHDIANSGMVQRVFEDTLVYDGYALQNPNLHLKLDTFFHQHGIDEIMEDAYELFQMYLNGYLETRVENL